MKTDPKTVPAPIVEMPPLGAQHEVAGCPTGLATPIVIVPESEAPEPTLEFEKLEGRQEGGRDAEDEDGEDIKTVP